MPERKLSVDILKTIGLVCVIFAHIDPPEWMFNFRVFDVCLLVFASGLTLKYHGRSLKEYIYYLVKRFKRLILPTWIFLIIYFTFSSVMSQFYGQWKYSFRDYIESFTFTGGIDYIWIIRVYFLLAIVSPLITKTAESRILKNFPMLCAAGMLAAVELLYFAGGFIHNTTMQKLFQNLFIYTLGYSIVEIIACYVKTNAYRKMSVIVSLVFIIVWMMCEFASPQTMKYPPRMLYILYGLCISLWLYSFAERDVQYPSWIQCIFKWFSKHSLWICFWHILPVTYIYKMGLDGMNFLLKYGLVLGIACLLTVVQNRLRNKVVYNE